MYAIDKQVKLNKKKSQKIKKTHTKEEKARLWEALDNDLNKPKPLLETPETDICILCNNVLEISENGLPTCTNKTCGIIYTNTITTLLQ